MSQKSSRRSFLKLAATSAAAAGITPVALSAPRAETLSLRTHRPVAPSDRIGLATIGMGIIGFIDTGTALRVPGVELVAAADLYDGRRRHVKEVFGDHVVTTVDYREILARPDVDAVIVSTPDHWHAQIARDAMEASKDVYLEKPMVQDIEEGPGVIETARRTNRIVQVGSQHASSVVFDKAKELYRDGAIGTLNVIEAVYNRNSALGAWQYSIPPDASPQTVDWDRFIGNAPSHAFDPIRFFRWRNYQDYGTGIAGDLYVHLFTGIHHVLDSHGPTEVHSAGGLRYWKDGRDVPDVILGLVEYPETEQHSEFTLALQSNFADGGNSGSRFRFIGNEGAITINGNGLTLERRPMREPSAREVLEGYNSVQTWATDVQEAFAEQYHREHVESTRPDLNSTVEYSAPQGYDSRLDHFHNFFNGVRSRQPANEDTVFGYRAAAPALLSNLSYFGNRTYHWDPEAMRIVDTGAKADASR